MRVNKQKELSAKEQERLKMKRRALLFAQKKTSGNAISSKVTFDYDGKPV